jgi:hypothetical protein
MAITHIEWQSVQAFGGRTTTFEWNIDPAWVCVQVHLHGVQTWSLPEGDEAVMSRITAGIQSFRVVREGLPDQVITYPDPIVWPAQVADVLRSFTIAIRPSVGAVAWVMIRIDWWE